MYHFFFLPFKKEIVYAAPIFPSHSDKLINKHALCLQFDLKNVVSGVKKCRLTVVLLSDHFEFVLHTSVIDKLKHTALLLMLLQSFQLVYRLHTSSLFEIIEMCSIKIFFPSVYNIYIIILRHDNSFLFIIYSCIIFQKYKRKILLMYLQYITNFKTVIHKTMYIYRTIDDIEMYI